MNKKLLSIATLLIGATLSLQLFRQEHTPAGAIAKAAATARGTVPVREITAPAPPPERIVAMPDVSPTAAGLWQTPSARAPMAAFQKWADDFVAQPSPDKTAAGVKLAQDRRAEMRVLIVQDPEQALANAVPESVRRALPADVRALLEEKVDGRGDLVVTATTLGNNREAAGGRSIRNTAQLSDGREFAAFVYGNRAFKPSRADIPLHGIALDGKMALSQWPGRVLEPVELAEAKQAAGGEPVCPVSEKPVNSTGTETAVLTGKVPEFYCGPAHARSVLRDASAAEAVRPPGFGIYQPQNAASSGVGQPVPPIAGQGDATWTTGTKRMMVARIKFSDGQQYDGLTISDCAEIVSRIGDSLLSWSYGRYYLRGVGTGGSSISPVLTMSKKASDYADMNALWNEVKQLLTSRGLGTGWDLLAVMAGNAPFSDPDEEDGKATWAGIGRVGGGLSLSRVNGADWTVEDRIASNTGVLLHEIGHNLGLYHASNIWNLSNFDLFGPETGAEYGDRYDLMGRSGQEYNARYKEWLHWLSTDSVPMAGSSGTYTLREHDREEDSGARGLQVMAGDFSFLNTYHLFVEYRMRTPVPQSGTPYVPYNDTLLAYGAQIRLGSPFSAKTWLLDATPETPNDEPVPPGEEDADTSGNVDSPLLPGRTFACTKDGKTTYITNVQAQPSIGLLEVEVEYGPVPGNDPPAGSITPSTPQGAPGQTVLFTANATDPEDADLAYHWRIPYFNVSKTLPAIFPNQRAISVQFPSAGIWPLSCLVSDKHGGTTLLTYSFSVVANSPPTISNVTDKALDEDTVLNNVSFVVNDATTPAANLNVSVSSSNIYLLGFGTMTLGGSGSSRTVSFAPPANRYGTAVVTLTVSDGALTAVDQFTVTVRPVTPGAIQLPSGSSGWRYWAAATAPAGNWTTAGYNDASWWQGTARFVYPTPNPPVAGWSTLPGTAGRTTCYFRKAVTMPALLTGTPTIRLLCDDGAVVYLNGAEVYRHNMPAGTPAHTTKALSSVEGGAEGQWITVPVSASSIIAGGSNLIAVEVHDAGGMLGGAGDVDFDLEVSTRQAPGLTPFTNRTSPEDQAAGPYNFTASDAETPGGQIYLRGSSSNPSLVLDDKITFTHDVISGQRTVTCTPQPNASGTSVITIKASDGVAETWRSFVLTVTPVNDPPTITASPDMTVPFGEVAPLLSLRVSDPDGNSASLQVTASASGVLQFQNLQVMSGPSVDTRWLLLQPNPGMAAQANVTVTVSDGTLSAADTFVFRVDFPATPNGDVIFISAPAPWRYLAGALPLAGGVPADFTAADFNDSAWLEKISQLGYGGNGERLYSGVGTQPYRFTTYFRKKFECGNRAAVRQLKLRMICDDGAAVYLNGTRVWSVNMPSVIDPSTPALASIEGAAEATWHTITIGTESLLTGGNTLAVEVHQNTLPTAAASGDLSFNLELHGVPVTPVPQDVIIPGGDYWSYWDGNVAGLGGSGGFNWTVANYDSNHWKYGLARLGYGTGGESTVINALAPGGLSHNASALFRKTFDIADPGAYSVIHLLLQRNDGAVVFLNGSKIIVNNMDTSPPEYPVYRAADPVTDAAGTQWLHYLVDPRRLIPGRNLLAISVHQSSSGDPSLNFNLQLTGELTGQPELFMQPSGEDMDFSWSGAYNGWQLQTSTDLINWMPAANTPILKDGWIYTSDAITGQRSFYRLTKP